MPALFVLDSSAILSGKSFDGILMTVSGVVDEIQLGGARERLELMLETGLAVSEPNDDALKKTRDAARATGDLEQLSRVDIELLALALERGATLLTDDFGMQNVATKIGVQYAPIMTDGITHIINWHYKCDGCKKTFDEEPAECPVCGSPVSRKRKTREPVSSR